MASLTYFLHFIFMLWGKNETTSEHIGSLIHICKAKAQPIRMACWQSEKHSFWGVGEIDFLRKVVGRWLEPLLGQRQPLPLPLLLSKVHNDGEQDKVHEKTSSATIDTPSFSNLASPDTIQVSIQKLLLTDSSECAAWSGWRFSLGWGRLKSEWREAWPPTERETCIQPATPTPSYPFLLFSLFPQITWVIFEGEKYGAGQVPQLTLKIVTKKNEQPLYEQWSASRPSLASLSLPFAASTLFQHFFSKLFSARAKSRLSWLQAHQLSLNDLPMPPCTYDRSTIDIMR